MAFSPSPSPPALARKELVRQYKEAAPPVGVYAIRNLATNRAYVDGSLNVHGAMNRARFELQLGAHRNAQLMRDWVESGPANFRFEILQLAKQHEDPAYDYAAELQVMLELWREECGGHTAQGGSHNAAAVPGRKG